MKAVLLKAYGGVDKLSYQDTADPKPGAGEVLIKIRATSINPIDYKIRSGAAKDRMPVTFPYILGRDLLGDVVELGDGVTSFNKGDRVMGFGNGSYAEFAVARADLLSPVPEALSDEQAGALPLVLLTGCQLIERAVKVQTGWKILITGALGSVGRTAVHVARQHGANILVGVRASQRKEAEALGAVEVVALDDEAEFGRAHELDAAADTVGGVIGERLLRHIKPGGVYGSVVGAPKNAKDFKVRIEMMQAQPDASRLYELADDVARGQFTIPIAKVMKLSEIREAQELAEKGGAGKVVLIP